MASWEFDVNLSVYTMSIEDKDTEISSRRYGRTTK